MIMELIYLELLALQAWCSHSPLVSVVIPVYNTEESLLRRAVENTMNQTYRNLQIILIDDASTNTRTLETINEFEW